MERESSGWALQRLRAMVLNHLKLGSSKHVGSHAVQGVADLARQWGASRETVYWTISDAVETSIYKESPEARILRDAFLLIWVK